MKKFLFLASVLFVLPTLAADVCSEEDLKSDVSCADVKPLDFGKTPDEIAKLRSQRRAKALRAKRRAQEKEPEKRRNNTYSRSGRGKWVGAHRKATKGEKREVKRQTRGRSMPQFGNRKAYNRFKQQSLKKGAFKQQGEKTAKQIFQDKKQKWGSNRPNLKARTDAVREGYLKNEPNLYERQRSRLKARGGRKNATTHFAEIRRKRREANGPYEPKTVRLRKLWKGDRLEGDLYQRFNKD